MGHSQVGMGIGVIRSFRQELPPFFYRFWDHAHVVELDAFLKQMLQVIRSGLCRNRRNHGFCLGSWRGDSSFLQGGEAQIPSHVLEIGTGQAVGRVETECCFPFAHGIFQLAHVVEGAAVPEKVLGVVWGC